EIVFPLEDPKVKEKAEHILDVELADTEQASILQPDGTYARVDRRGKEKVNSQLIFSQEAVAAAKAAKPPVSEQRVFVPETHQPEE
ncbi:MAG: RNA degradosome polyphosphate kinase, partial [Lachnospiraceae bacterium]|nr:RNA degradosome polyphosphate kinase [Lachnospiraceae bacterium]